MQLTRSQHRALSIYRWYHKHPPAWQFYLATMIWRSSYVIYLGVFVIAVLVGLISRGILIGGWPYLLLGLILGVVLRNFRLYQQTIRLWPMLDAIIDWDRVEALLASQSSGTHGEL
jgi:hypothetical protein